MSRLVLLHQDWAARLPGGPDDLLRLLVAAPMEGDPPGTWEPLTKPGLGGRERWRWRLPDGRTVLYVKRYTRTPMRADVDRILRQHPAHSRAWWEYTESARLETQYVAAVKAIGVAEDMLGWREQRSVALFEVLPGEALDRAWQRLTAMGAAVTRGAPRLDLVRRLARFLSAFHQTGARHRDLYLCHIFAELDSSGRRPPHFALLDLARILRPRVRRMRWLLKDLSQLDASARECGASRADRLRFLTVYLGLEPGAPRIQWHARKIVRRSDHLLRRIARRAARQVPPGAS